MTVHEIAYLLRTRLAEQLATGLTEEDDQLSFLQLGVDSVIATELIEFIRREVEPEVSVSALFDFPTVSELALHLAKRGHVDLEGHAAGPDGSSDIVPESETYSQALPTVASSKSGQYSKAAMSATPRMPIAVVGVSGRFPGANNVRELWRNLASGVCSTAEIPIQRSRYWDLSNLASRAGQTCLWGGFLNDVECFDPHFFNIPSSEASVMDPQQRLFLEEAWKATEDAGYASDALSESRCGVYVGVMNTDFQDLLTHVTAQAPKVHELVGSAASILAARIAHYLNLRGPAIAMDTACSSSMVAIDLACRALQLGEIDMALAGGVTLYLTQKRYNLMEQAGMLSRTGLCRPFDEAADGMIPGEGVGVVVLKRLEDSLADGDSIYGVIVASGTNHAGKTNGITAPSTQSQFELISEVYRRSNIDPATIQYVEGHGTGTRLGDPIEVEALTKIFQATAREGQFCRLGSIKANLGHTTAAAGVAGLIKVLLSLQHRAIPPQIHFEVPNRHTDYASSPFRINTVIEPWEGKDGRPRRAAVSSFGFSGTNAHLVVQEAPAKVGYETSRQRAGFWITLSAKNSKGLERKADELAHWLATEGENASIIDLSYTLAIGRSAFDERLAFVAHDLVEVRAGLQQFLTSVGDDLHLWRGRAGAPRESSTPGEAWVSGATVDWASFYNGLRPCRLHLPAYPFERERYWYDTFESTPPYSSNAQQFERVQPVATVQDCLYEVTWQSSELLALPKVWQPGTWLLLADRQGWADRLSGLLSEFGQQCVILDSEQVGTPAELEAILEQLETREPPLRHIVNFWSLNLSAEINAVTISTMQRVTLVRMLQLVQVLSRRRREVSLHLITRGAHAVSVGDRVEPTQTPVWGLGKVIGLELPQFWGGLVDLPTSTDLGLAELLLAELVTNDDEDQVALRSGQRYVARLNRLQKRMATLPLRLHAEASYLITGGLGSLGLKTACWLAEQGAENIVLAGRREPSEAAQATIEQLRSRSKCRVEVWKCDVSRSEDVARLIAEIGERLPPLRGIVHVAGLASQRAIVELSADELSDVLAAKVQGAWSLHEYTREIKLDFFVGFSSIASVWGAVGQGHYAAANAFLDGLMWYRQAQGLAGTSLNFGPWSGGGLATEEVRRWLDRSGVKTLTPTQALHGWQMVQGQTQAVIADVDWPRFQIIYQARRRRPLLAELAPIDKAPITEGKTLLVQELERASVSRRRPILEDHLRRLIGQALGINPAQIDSQAGFFDQGMDSLMAVEFRHLLQKATGHSLPATLAMDRPRLGDLVDYLLGEVLALETVKGAEPVTVNLTRRESSIAVIGLACRTPGASSSDAFWRLLEQGRDAIAEIPADRWDLGIYYDPDPEKPGKIYTRYAGLLDQIEWFDASLFGIVPREAVSMDPQQRLLLEVAWEALEDANIAPLGLVRTRTGVYIGASANEYGDLITAAGPDAIDAHFGTGNAMNVIAGRLAFTLGMEGPALVIDTACSSSLVAVHQACQALLSRECDLTLAGGVNLLLSPKTMIAACRARMLAADGRCKTFDATANGYVRGEGCGVLVLKRLDDAERCGDRILAVIRGSAVNQDGASSGLTVPNGPSQKRVILDALRQAKLDPHEVAYLEAHGTGTSLGDPIEVQAAAAAFGPGRAADRPLLIGSVKTNVGHLEAAAGIAGLIKVILAIRHGVIPPHLHFRQPNPHIEWERLPVKVTTEATPWPRGRKIAAVSSFGFSGTNAHVIVEEPPAEKGLDRPDVSSDRSDHVLVLSARTQAALRDLAGRYLEWLETHPEAVLADVCYSAGVGRSHLPARAALPVNSVGECRNLLSKLQQSESVAELFYGQATKKPKVAWLFTDQGSQYVGMGKELYETQPLVREVLERCAAVLAKERENALLEALFERDELLNNASYTQPALFAVEVALAELWLSWGQEPDVVLGQGVGQYAAAVISGVLSLESGLRLVAKRAELIARLPEGVAMMEPMLEEFEAYARGLEFRQAERTLICNLTGDALAPGQVLGADYWRRHIREPAQFARSIQTVAELGVELLLELGPQPVLLEMAERCWPETRESPAKVASLRRGQSETRQLAEATAELYVRGLTPDFASWDRPWNRRKLMLPSYPFQRSRYWIETHPQRASLDDRPAHALLGIREELASGEVVHSTRFGYQQQPWLLDHKLYQTVVVPGSTYAAMALCAKGLPAELRDVAFKEPLLLPDSHGPDLQLRFSAPTNQGERRFEIHSRRREREPGPWVQHASGVIKPIDPLANHGDALTIRVEELQGRMEPWKSEELFAYFAKLQLELGPTLQSVKSLWRGSDEALGELVIADQLAPELSGLPIHPVILDACTQVIAAIPCETVENQEEIFYAPFHYGRLLLYERVPGWFFCHATRQHSASAETRVFDLDLIAPEGGLFGKIKGFTLKRAPRKAFLRGLQSNTGQLLYRIAWREQPVSEFLSDRTTGSWLILADGGTIGQKLAVKLRQRQQRCILATRGEGYRLLRDDHYEVPIDDGDAWQQLLADPALVKESLQGIIHLWSLDGTPNVRTSPRVLEQDAHFSCGGLRALVQALITREQLPNRGLWLVTNGTQMADPVTLQTIGQSPLWGMGRVLQNEHPDLACRLIDLDDPITESALEELVKELERPAVENQVALRGRRRLVPRLVRGAARDPDSMSFRDDATYLITGGLGGIGLELARWLVEHGARHLVLNGRNEPNQQAQAAIVELHARGVSIEVYRADVSKEEQVRSLLAHINRSLPSLKGVFHLAGLVRDGAVLSQKWQDFVEVLAPKVQGAWNLHTLTADQPIDWFVLFSSAAGVLGNPGQANYAAANAFLDSLAHYRRRVLGLPAVSIDWSAWSEVGMAARQAEELSRHFHRTGLGWIKPQHALLALEQVISGTDPSVAVLSIDWPVLTHRDGRVNFSSLFAELVDLSAKQPHVPSNSRLINRLQGAKAQEQLALLTEFVGQEVKNVLRTEVLPNPITEFSELGMDSLMAVDLRNRLQNEFQERIQLPQAIAFEYPNVTALATYLSDNLQAQLQPNARGITSDYSDDTSEDTRPQKPVASHENRIERKQGLTRSRSVPAFEPIAIIGISGRFPGARDLESFWQNLSEGKSSITEVPSGRWPAERLADIRWGGFLDGIDEFDAAFFNMARGEAEQIDPQHRLFLQEAWKAVEDSGYSPRELKGRSNGIFVGTGASDYYAQILELNGHTLPGNVGSGLTGRLAYLLDWTGPCLALDTACASSFSAIHLACTSLARGECDLALAGGVHVATSPKAFVVMNQMGMLSPSGRCRTFDAAADGWVLSEGVGAVILKRLEDAERDADHIYGVIRGCGLNQDGSKNGFTSPKAEVQTALQRHVYQQAGINPESIDYIEVHGTSSVIGDEVELFALKESYAAFTRQRNFCAISSLKPNIGHPFYAAGMACVAKVLLALRHEQLPPLITPDKVNEGLGLDASPFYLNTRLTEWKRRDGRPRRAAINGLSASGTNSHLIIEEYLPASRTVHASSTEPSPALILLSARDSTRLRESAANLLRALERNPSFDLIDVAFTLQVGRQPMEERLAFTAGSLEEVKRKLSGYLAGENRDTIHRNRVEEVDLTTSTLLSGEEGKQFLALAIRNQSLDILSRLWATGVEVEWRFLYESAQPYRVSLPTYPFARESYWLSSVTAVESHDSTERRNGNGCLPAGNSNGASTLIESHLSARIGTDASDPVTDLLRGIIAAVLRCAPAEIDPDRDLFRYGFGSLYVMRVVERFEGATGFRLPARAFFECRTIRQLVRIVAQQADLRILASNVPENHLKDRGNASNGTGTTEPYAERIAGPFPLSEGQKALWSIQQSNPGNTAYHVPVAIFWEEPLDVAAMDQVFQRLVEEQPALRTTFLFQVAEPVQLVHPAAPIAIQRENLDGLTHAETLQRIREVSRRPFDLERGPLWRAFAFSISATRSIFLLNLHHLIFDGHSLGFLLEEIERRYRGIRNGTAAASQTISCSVAEYVQSERQYLDSETFRQDRAYWLKQFPNGLARLGLLKERVLDDGREADVFQTSIPESVVQSLKGLAGAERVTLQTVFLAAFEALLAIAGHKEEVVAAVAVDVRPSEGFEDVIGFFVNMLPILAKVSGSISLRDLLRQIFEQLMEALDHRRFPFRQLVQALREEHANAGEPQAAFYFQMWNSPERCQLADRLVPQIHQTGEFDLVFEVVEAQKDWRLNVKYRTGAFELAMIERLTSQFQDLLLAFAQNPDGSLDQLCPAERPNSSEPPVEEFDYPRERCVHGLIEDQVLRMHNAVAVLFKDQRLTYRELDERANQLAHYLIASGVRPGALVGVMLDRSLEMLVGLLACWKAGAAYVPLDPNHPSERLGYILSDAQVQVLLTESSRVVRPKGIRVVEIDLEKAAVSQQPMTNPSVPSSPENLAYVIYTSGSTGKPKGVQITHRSLVHFLWSMAERPGCTVDDYVLASTTICFDIAALELFLPLVTGARVEILPEEIVKDGLRLKSKIEGSPATLFQGTPATWKMLLEAELGSIPRVKALCGGEAWDSRLADQLLARTRELWNMYGPTETTIWSSIQKLAPGHPVHLGDPVGNTKFYVFDEAMQPVQPGEIGELFIGGEGLAKGYLNRPELTQERFVPNPLRPEEVIYRTGDLVRYV